MTIKQLGGVFGRNPTFNDVTIEGTLTFDGAIDITSDLTIEDNLYVLGSVGIGTTSVDSNITNGIDMKDFVVGRYDFSSGVPSDGLGGVFSVDANATGFFSGDLVLQCRPGVNSRSIKFYTGNTSTERLQIKQSGDISFYDSAGSSESFLWDASAESLGIGTTTPARLLELETTTANESYLRISGSSGNTEDANFAGIEFYNLDSSAAGPNVASFIEARAETATGAGGELVFATLPSTASEGARAIERLRIDASGKVGIGTVSPSAKLDTAYTDSATYSSTSPSADLILSRKNTGNTANETVGIRFDITGWSGSTTGGAAIEAIQPSNASTADLAFLTRDAGTWGERMRITSDGSVGIGTAPSQVLHVNSGNVNDVALFESTDLNARISLKDNTATAQVTSNSGNMVISCDTNDEAADSFIGFRVDNDEKLRIDSSGNLLVGTTSESTWESAAGFRTRSSGSTTITRDGNPPLYVNRLTSYGTTVQFQKGTDVVGSIGSYVTGPSMFIGSGNTGVLFADGSDSVHPWNPSTNAGNDDALDLGSSSQRFKDLYLSGNIDISTSSDPQTAFVDVAKTINDDAVYSFTPDKPIGIIYIYGRNANYSQAFGMVSYRTTATAYCVEVLDPNSFISTSTSVLTGTSGTDGQITISAVSSDGKIYIENRINNTISIGVHVSGQ